MEMVDFVSPTFIFTPAVILGMAVLAIACAVGCVLLIARTMTRGECECPPRVLRNQNGGYTAKTYHTTLCRFRNRSN
jgi:hypothetical protein